mgnify:CR=1 FL=1
MSNTTCRPRGIAQRALALLMAIALATALTPSFAFAGEVNNVAATTAEQSQTTESVNSSSAVNDAASRADTTAPDANGAQTSSSSNAAENATTSSPKADVGEATNPNSGEPANQASSTQAETVTAKLKISVYGTTLVSHTFDIEKGKTVEDMLNLAVKQGYISSYSHGKPLLGHTAYYVNGITVNGIAYTQPADYSEYWSSTINGAWENNGINGNIIETDGFSYELNYASNDPNTKYDNGTGTYPTSPNAPHPDKATGSDTTSYVKNTGNTSTVTSAPTSSSNAALAWKKNYGNNNYSEILTLGDSIYFASSLLNPDWTAQPAVLHRLNAKTGEETASLQLFSAIDSTCRPVYTDGVIVVPLANGRLQGVSATEMKTLWVSNAIAAGDMNMSTVTAANGMVFTGTTSNWNATKGTFFGINAITGDCVWANKSEDAGYYWAGVCKVGNVLVYGDNAGWLKAVDPATGKVVSQLKLSSAIRSTVVSNEAGTTAYMTTNDGTLHVLSVAIDGSLSEQNVVLDSTKALCTSTPTLFEGNLYVGGGVYGSKGYFSVIDASTLQVKSTIEVPYYVQSTPLVAKAVDGKTYAYFTCNGAETDENKIPTNGGGAWVYCLETNTATKLFEATGDMANWCTKSIVMGPDGTLYWTNDSGTLFALANAASSSNGNDSDSTQTPEKPGTNNQQNNKAPDSNPSEHALAATPISAGDASAAAQAPLSNAEELAENEASNEEENGSAVTSASSARGTSSNNGNDSKGAPWLPIAGIVAGCAGLVAVGAFLFRRRSL